MALGAAVISARMKSANNQIIYSLIPFLFSFPFLHSVHHGGIDGACGCAGADASASDEHVTATIAASIQ